MSLPFSRHFAYKKILPKPRSKSMLCLKLKQTFLLLLLFVVHSAFAQYYPPVSIYEPETYNAGNQNWMMDQDEQGNIFVANNEGLLIFNGSTWKLFPTPNQSIVRSVKLVENRVYTGHNLDFGYWTKRTNGTYEFSSLVKKLKIKLEEDEQFWGIEQIESLILFQSFKKIYIYDPKFETIKVISQNNGIKKLFKVGNTIYYHSLDNGIYKIQNEISVPFYLKKDIASASIINMFLTNEGIKLLTKEKGFFQFNNGVFEKWQIKSEEVLNLQDFFSAIQLKNGNFALGTISRGLIVLDKEGKLIHQIDRSKGLSNNTVLSLKEDRSNNVWLGLDNGINCVNLASPYREYIDRLGILGTVYASIIYEDALYLGTNQGLFQKALSSNDDFQFVPNTNGQVWSLFVYDNTLFCGHDKGTFIVKNKKAQRIATQEGTWHFVPLADQADIILQGNYNGFNVLKKINQQWQYSHYINGYQISARNFVLLDKDIYLNHGTNGLTKLQLDPSFENITKVDQIPGVVSGKNASLVKLNDQLYYATQTGIYRLNRQNDRLEKDETISNFLETKEHIPVKLIVDKRDRMWLFTRNDILYFQENKSTGELDISEITIDKKLLKSMHGYENLNALSDDSFLIGLTDGYFYINLDHLKRLDKDYEVFLHSVLLNSLQKQDSLINLQTDGQFHYKENNIEFFFSVPQTVKYQAIKYQYQLEGLQNSWSDWTEQNSIQFSNLKYGDYSLKLRAKVGNNLSKNIASYSFTISRPWYYSRLAIALYILLAFAIAYLINSIYKKYYRSQQRKLIEKNRKEIEYMRLKNEQELIKLKNEQLNAEMNTKNKELAINTMNLIKKNEFLISIRDALLSDNNSQEQQKKKEKVINSINKELENEETWELFKNAFDNVDKNFFKKIKEIHPQLTPNDIKLCTYLRLNLSSKEIAPLLNISVRSMEIKRYRLRKKMQLKHETNLVEYIMSI